MFCELIEGCPFCRYFCVKISGSCVVIQSKNQTGEFLSEKSIIKQSKSQRFIDLKVSRDHYLILGRHPVKHTGCRVSSNYLCVSL